jgi:hypothetical protein
LTPEAKSPETLGNIAVIFDSQIQTRRKGGFIGKAEATTNTFSDRVKFAPPVTPATPTQPAFIDQANVLDLINGVNLGIPQVIWDLHTNGERFKYYQAANAFEVIFPLKGKEGTLYSDYKPDDAIKLIQATLSTTLLKQFGAGEERPLVLEELQAQQKAIEEEIQSRIARNSSL